MNLGRLRFRLWPNNRKQTKSWFPSQHYQNHYVGNHNKLLLEYPANKNKFENRALVVLPYNVFKNLKKKKKNKNQENSTVFHIILIKNC